MYCEFDKLSITTQTYVLYTNVSVVMEKFLEHIPVSTLDGARRNSKLLKDDTFPEGTIIYLKYGGVEMGTPCIRKKGNKERRGSVNKKPRKLDRSEMANCLAFYIRFDKYYYVRFSVNGKIHITGCVSDEIPIKIFRAVWAILEPHKEVWKFKYGESIVCQIVAAMMNNTFSLNFELSRAKLDRLLVMETDFRSMFEPSIGYVGINVKVKNKHTDFSEEEIKEITPDEIRVIKYGEHLKLLSEKDRRKRIEKLGWTTFLIFYNGKVIMSGGLSEKNRRQAYNDLLKFILAHKEEIEFSRGKKIQ